MTVQFNSTLPIETTTPAASDPGVIVRVVGGSPLAPPGATVVTASSGNVANAPAVAAMPAVAGVTNYVTGMIITGAGATAAAVIAVTLTGVTGGTMTFIMDIPAGDKAAAPILDIEFSVAIPASAANTAITLTAPAFGAGNTNAAAVIYGFKI